MTFLMFCNDAWFLQISDPYWLVDNYKVRDSNIDDK